MIEFTPYPKTARLFKDGLGMVVTEKIDGTNAAVGVIDIGPSDDIAEHDAELLTAITYDDTADRWYGVYAQSRNRIIRPVRHTEDKGSDNYGFAQWTFDNAKALVRTLGPGLHYGEWWGQGIARKYDMDRKVFSLFNTSRWRHLDVPEARLSLGIPNELRVVPVLYVGQLDSEDVLASMRLLESHGSYASPGFMQPEGVCVYLPSVRQTFKVTFDGDKPKWQLAAQAA
jgi:hypothetical protein